MHAITEIPLDQLSPHPRNPRRDVGDIAELADSIRAQGVRQNLLVVPHDPDDRYRVVIGHRRLAAAQAAGLETVPCIIDPALTDQQQIELMLVENLQRADLTPIEEATGYQDLLDLGMSAPQIRKTTGRARSTVQARLRLLQLPEDAREKIHTRQASLEDATLLSKIIDTAADYPDLAEDVDLVAAALGTNDFDWRAKHFQSTVDGIREAHRWSKEVIVAGIPEITSEQLAAGEWVRRRLWDARDVDRAVKEGPAGGAAWRIEGAGLYILRPAPTEDDRGEADRKREAAREAREAHYQQAQGAWQLRNEFLTGWVGRTKVTDPERDAILDTLLPAILDGNTYMGRHDRERWCIEVGVDHDALLPLQLLVAQAQSGSQYAWTHHGQLLHDLYVTLRGLGYQLSDVETAWMAAAEEKYRLADEDGDDE